MEYYKRKNNDIIYDFFYFYFTHIPSCSHTLLYGGLSFASVLSRYFLGEVLSVQECILFSSYYGQGDNYSSIVTFSYNLDGGIQAIENAIVLFVCKWGGVFCSLGALKIFSYGPHFNFFNMCLLMDSTFYVYLLNSLYL